MNSVIHMVREVYAYRELLLALSYRDIRVKYKQAAAGILWVFFMPLLAISSGIIFRVVMARVAGRSLEFQDMAGVMVKSMPWLLFAGIVGSSSNSLVGSMGLITKIYFPREVIPLSNLVSQLFDFSIAVTGLILILLGVAVIAPQYSPVAFTPWLLMVPVLLGILIMMAVGLGLFLGAANLFLRDVKYIVNVLLQFGILLSAVYFNLNEFGAHAWLFNFNPVVPILECLRMAVIEGHVDAQHLLWLGYSTVIAVALLMISTTIFDRAEYLFAEFV